jgi:hypothetical protein
MAENHLTHGAYKALRLAKKGNLPDRRSRVGKAIHAMEQKVIEHFGGLNNLQQIELFNLLPLMVFLLKKPATNDKGQLDGDWKWAWNKVENGLKVLCQLADRDNGKRGPSLGDWIEAQGSEK